MYKIRVSNHFLRKGKKLFRKNKKLADSFYKVLETMSYAPFHPRLKTHKVTSKYDGVKRSTQLTGDLRIIWEFDQTGAIRLLDIGSHSGGKKVYR